VPVTGVECGEGPCNRFWIKPTGDIVVFGYVYVVIVVDEPVVADRLKSDDGRQSQDNKGGKDMIFAGYSIHLFIGAVEVLGDERILWFTKVLCGAAGRRNNNNLFSLEHKHVSSNNILKLTFWSV